MTPLCYADTDTYVDFHVVRGARRHLSSPSFLFTGGFTSDFSNSDGDRSSPISVVEPNGLLSYVPGEVSLSRAIVDAICVCTYA